MSKGQKFDAEKALQAVIANADPSDIAVMAMGFFAGYNGLTMIDYFLGTTALSTQLNDLYNKIKVVENEALDIFISPATTEWNKIFGQPAATTTDPNPPADWSSLTADQIKKIKKAQTAKIGLGCMGAIVAFAFTRPGFLPALMQLAGSVLKDVTGGSGSAISSVSV